MNNTEKTGTVEIPAGIVFDSFLIDGKKYTPQQTADFLGVEVKIGSKCWTPNPAYQPVGGEASTESKSNERKP